MARRPTPPRQLTLAIERPRHPGVELPDGVVQALADLLLEAVAADVATDGREVGDEPEDHR